MLSNSLRTRGIVFAFLFGPPRFVARAEASKVHNALCEKLGYDDISFQYGIVEGTKGPQSKGFSIVCTRKEGRGALLVQVDNAGVDAPLRLLISHDWPPSLEHVKETFDTAADAVFNSLEGTWQRVLAEVRLRAQCTAQGGSAIGFIRDHLLRLDKDRVDSLGSPLVFGSIKLVVGASTPVTNTLDGARRDLTVEVLREDPRELYVEYLTQWPQVAIAGGPPADASALRPIDRKPGEYVESAHVCLQERLGALTNERKGNP